MNRNVMVAAAASLALAACAHVQPATVTPLPPAAPENAQTVLVVAKVQFSFEAVYNTAAHAYLAAAPHLDSATKIKAKGLLHAAYQAVLQARAATKADNPNGVLAWTKTITDLTTQATNLIKGTSP